MLCSLLSLQSDLEGTVRLFPGVSRALPRQQASHCQGSCTPGNISALHDPSNTCAFLATPGVFAGMTAQGSTALGSAGLQSLALVPARSANLGL